MNDVELQAMPSKCAGDLQNLNYIQSHSITFDLYSRSQVLQALVLRCHLNESRQTNVEHHQADYSGKNSIYATQRGHREHCQVCKINLKSNSLQMSITRLSSSDKCHIRGVGSPEKAFYGLCSCADQAAHQFHLPGGLRESAEVGTIAARQEPGG